MILLCIKCGYPEHAHPSDHAYLYEPDNCEICEGRRGGMKGNENIVDGIVMCDYCYYTISTYKKLYETKLALL